MQAKITTNTADRVPVLMYHRIEDTSSLSETRYTISPKNYAAHMQALKRAGFIAIKIDAFVEWLEGGPPLPDKAIVITFDDGFLGVYQHALPIMEYIGWPFCVFLVSDKIGKTDDWSMSACSASSSHPLLNIDSILDMQQRGVSFHSHTRSHASLISLDDKALTDELIGSKIALGELLGKEVSLLAYPYGHVDERVQVATRTAGYRAAFSTRSGFNRRDVNRYLIRRIDVYGSDTPGMLLRKVELGTNNGGLGVMLRYYSNRLRAPWLPKTF